MSGDSFPFRRYKNTTPDLPEISCAVSDETFDLAKLAEHMSKHNSPYSGGVIKGVLSDMVDCIKELLLDGKCVKIDDLAIFGVGIRSKAADTLEEFSLEKNISGMRLKARATGNLSTNNLKLDSQLKQQAEYQKPTTAGGGSYSGDNPDPKPDGGGEAPDPAAIGLPQIYTDSHR